MKEKDIQEEKDFIGEESEAQSESQEESELEESIEDQLNNQIEQLKNERDDFRNQMLRAWADLKNFRKRSAIEKEETRKFATENLVHELLPVLDNFDRALESIKHGADLDSVVQGIKMVDRQLRSALQSVQVVAINSLGENFDPELHEAITTEASEEKEEGTILEVIEPGYLMADKVIRPSKVKVAKNP